MAAPTYSQQFSIGLLGTISNLLSQPMTFYRCTVCGSVIAEGQTGTAGRDLHTAWHAALDSTASAASSAVTAANAASTTANAAKTAADTATTAAGTATTTANAAKTTASGAATTAGQAQTLANQAAADASAAKTSAGKSATDAASALTTASGAADAAGRAQTAASDALTRAKTADDAAVAANAAVTALIEQTGMCPLCRAEVATDKINVHLTYHYRRAHGDPVEFPADFDPTTQDMAEVDPPMRVANQG